MKDLNLENLQSGEFNDSQSNNDMDNQSQRSGTTSINLDALGVHNKKISKNEKRLIQNRVSAQRFRQKRKNEFETLKDNLNIILQENELLRNQVNELNAVLKHQQEIHHQQEVQMSAIQSSLMEIFCKQILTQQGVSGSPQQNGQVNIQALASQFLSGLPSQQTSNPLINSGTVSGNMINRTGGDFMKNFNKLMEFQNSSSAQLTASTQSQAKPQFSNIADSSNLTNILQNLIQQPQQNQNSNQGANLNQSVLQAFIQNGQKEQVQDINQNQQIIQQMTQSLKLQSANQDQQVNRSNTPLMQGQFGLKSSPMMKSDISHQIIQKASSMTLPQGVVTPKCNQTYKAKMAQPVVLVSNGQGQSPKSKNITPKSGTVNMLENLIHQVRNNCNNNDQRSNINYRERLQSYSNNISGNITPASQLAGQSQNNINMSQITQLLKNAQNQSQTNTAELSSSAETRDNSSLMKRPSAELGSHLMNNCFSFNKLLTNKGNAVSSMQGFHNQLTQKQADVSNNGDGETHQSKNSS